ncbi:hypothetical protein F485_gp147 [Aeromonas phage CC2]|uniref:Uncharacterized protein n=1 Tax=Aeromonas phage CC2 TaxID=1204516 RepID=I6WLY6_9CAUD|nr:hypothetical protein F485_gp147 [Aeromonas phage CC2]AFN39238.1 hypothetical protein CC2_151 [Aeromonas phage CC2]
MKFSRETGAYSVESRDIFPIIDKHVRSRMEKHKQELNDIDDNEKFVIAVSKLFYIYRPTDQDINEISDEVLKLYPDVNVDDLYYWIYEQYTLELVNFNIVTRLNRRTYIRNKKKNDLS